MCWIVQGDTAIGAEMLARDENGIEEMTEYWEVVRREADVVVQHLKQAKQVAGGIARRTGD